MIVLNGIRKMGSDVTGVSTWSLWWYLIVVTDVVLSRLTLGRLIVVFLSLICDTQHQRRNLC